MGGDMTWSRWLLLTLSLPGILAGNWSVNLPSGPIFAVIGSSVVLPCFYDYPQSSNETRGEQQGSTKAPEGERYRVLSEMWCLNESRCITPRYVFHSADILLDPCYQNRVQYLGQPGTKDCSLRISNLRELDSGTYVFYLITSHPTQKMPEQRGVQLLVTASTLSSEEKSSGTRMIVIGVSIAVLLAIMAVVFFIMHRRQRSATNQSYVLAETTAAAP